jgi:catechol 2,3-dioxygenase-like lactoylglutathione lyase family enzyme
VIAGLDHVQLAAPPGCEEDARRFFGGLLGLPELEKPSTLAARGGAWFECGAQAIHVGVEDEFAPARKAHPAFALGSASEVDALGKRLREVGVDVRFDEELPGYRRFYASDPWGIRLEFLAPTVRP